MSLRKFYAIVVVGLKLFSCQSFFYRTTKNALSQIFLLPVLWCGCNLNGGWRKWGVSGVYDEFIFPV